MKRLMEADIRLSRVLTEAGERGYIKDRSKTKLMETMGGGQTYEVSAGSSGGRGWTVTAQNFGTNTMYWIRNKEISNQISLSMNVMRDKTHIFLAFGGSPAVKLPPHAVQDQQGNYMAAYYAIPG